MQSTSDSYLQDSMKAFFSTLMGRFATPYWMPFNKDREAFSEDFSVVAARQPLHR